MEVTRKNFEEVLPEISTLLKKCNFVSIDAEYTGLHPEHKSCDKSLFETPSERYDKLRVHVAERFTICQIGLAFYFKSPELDDERNHYVEAYSFYVFPVQFADFEKRKPVILQVSAANFLAHNGFNFDKFIKEGIPYLNKEDCDDLRKYLSTNRHCLRYCELIDESYFPKRGDKINTSLTDEAIEEHIRRLQGFSKVIDLISKSRKPVVGHNCLMDLMLIYRLFCDKLPVKYLQFKDKLHAIFPIIYDTKCVARGLNLIRITENSEDRQLCDSNLYALYTSTSQILKFNLRPLIIPMGESTIFGSALVGGYDINLTSVSSAQCHCAGFDALITGAVFIKLGYIASRNLKLLEFQQGSPPTMSEIMKRLSPWKDDVNMARCILPNINISKGDPSSKRPDVIVIRKKRGRKPIIAVELENNLAKYGDVEVRIVVPHEEAEILCSSETGFKRVYKYLCSVNDVTVTTRKITFGKMGLIFKSISTWWCASLILASCITAIGFSVKYRRR